MKLLIIIIVSSFSVFSQSNFRPKFSVMGSGNLYRSNFKELPNVPNCCDNFSNGNGLGFEIGLGFDYYFNEKLFGISDYYSFGIFYKDYGGLFEKDVVSGNIIREFGFEPGISRISIRPDINYIFTSHYLNFKFIDNIPLIISPGFDIGFGAGATFEQKEEAISPSDYVFETDTRIRDEQNGDINDFNSLFLGATLNIKYEGIKFGEFNIQPEFSYRYSFLPVITSIDWNTSSMNLGFSVIYDRKKIEKLPEPPPQPLPLEPEKPLEIIPLEAELLISINEESAKDGDIFNYEVQKTNYVEVYSLPSIIYYKEKNDKPIEKDLNGIGLSFGSQEDMLEIIFDEIIKGDLKKLLIYSAFGDNVLKQRKDYIIEKLKDKGFLESLPIEFVDVNSNDLKYEELAEEQEKAEFIFEDKELLSYKFKETEKVNINDTINVKINFKSNYDDALFQYTLEYGGRTTNDMSNEFNIFPMSLLANYDSHNDIKINARISTDDESEQEIFINQQIRLNPVMIEDVKYNFKEQDNSSQYVLGYFNFDETRFSKIDEDIINKVKIALKGNKKVVMLPLTDNLGTGDYNQRLAEKRIESAKKLFANSNKIKVEYPKEPLFDNNHPFGRTLNRAIIVRIYEN